MGAETDLELDYVWTEYLLCIDDVHDDAAFQHLSQASLHGEVGVM